MDHLNLINVYLQMDVQGEGSTISQWKVPDLTMDAAQESKMGDLSKTATPPSPHHTWVGKAAEK